MKTAISIPDELFQDVVDLAEKENTSRSKIFTDAVREYLDRRSNHKLLRELNEVYGAEETSEEKQLRKRSQAYYVRRLRKEKW